MNSPGRSAIVHIYPKVSLVKSKKKNPQKNCELRVCNTCLISIYFSGKHEIHWTVQWVCAAVYH